MVAGCFFPESCSSGLPFCTDIGRVLVSGGWAAREFLETAMQTTESSLAKAAVEISAQAAALWARQNDYYFSDEDVRAFGNLLRSRLKIGIDEALADARNAMACGMVDAAEMTFRASLVLIGIEAAKIHFGVASAA